MNATVTDTMVVSSYGTITDGEVTITEVNKVSLVKVDAYHAPVRPHVTHAESERRRTAAQFYAYGLEDASGRLFPDPLEFAEYHASHPFALTFAAWNVKASLSAYRNRVSLRK